MRREKNVSTLTIISVFMLFIIAMIYCTFYIINAVPNNDEYFSSYNTIVDNVLKKQLEKQNKVDSTFDEILENGGYTLTDPYVINNPYGISPLSSLILFRTKEETSITVRINDGSEYKIDSAKKHIIPIYGLISNATNKVTLISDDGNYKDIEIDTEEFNNNLDGLDVDMLRSDKNDVAILSPTHKYFRVFDENKNLIYYLDLPFINSFVFYNKSIVLSYNSVDNLEPIKVEIDYVGRIKSISSTTEDIISKDTIIENGLEYNYFPINLYRNLDNYEITDVDNNYEVTKSDSVKLGLLESNLLESPAYEKDFNVSVNGNYLTFNIDEKEGEIILVGKDNSFAYIYNIKDNNKIVIGNNNEYALYFRINDKYYNLMKTVNI